MFENKTAFNQALHLLIIDLKKAYYSAPLDYDEMNYMNRKFTEEYTNRGVEVNLNKTEYMSIGGKQLDNGQHIKQFSA